MSHHTPGHQAFQPVYEARLEADSFRLLSITFDHDATSNSANRLISCRLGTQPLTDAPEYAALSYAWNEPQALASSAVSDYHILLDGHKIQVKPNLYCALHQISVLEDATQLQWWIDDLCIN